MRSLWILLVVLASTSTRAVEWGIGTADWTFDQDATVRARQIGDLRALGVKYVRSHWPNFGRGGDPWYTWFAASHEVTVCAELLGAGLTPIRVLVNNNEGIESAVPSAVWQSFLTFAGGSRAEARIALIKAGLLAGDRRVWKWLIDFAYSEADRLPSGVVFEAVNPDVWFAGTDGRTWTAHTPQYLSACSSAGYTLAPDPSSIPGRFADALESAVGRPILRNSWFLYDWRTGDVRWTGNSTSKGYVCEFGVSVAVTTTSVGARMSALAGRVVESGASIACWHQAADPSEGPWTWPTRGRTYTLWDPAQYALYKASVGRPLDQFAIMPSVERRSAVIAATRL